MCISNYTDVSTHSACHTRKRIKLYLLLYSVAFSSFYSRHVVSESPDLDQGEFYPSQSSVWFLGTGGTLEGYEGGAGQPCCSLRSPLPSISPERAKPLQHIQAVKTSGLLTQLFFPHQGKKGQLALHKKRWEVGESWWGGVSHEFEWGFCRFENSQCYEVSCYHQLGGTEVEWNGFLPIPALSVRSGGCMCLFQVVDIRPWKRLSNPKTNCEEPQVFSEKEKICKVQLYRTNVVRKSISKTMS